MTILYENIFVRNNMSTKYNFGFRPTILLLYIFNIFNMPRVRDNIVKYGFDNRRLE